MVLSIDARICQPTVGLTTTTRRPETSPLDLRKAEQELWKALRTGRRIGTRGRRKKGEADIEAFPDLRYCGFLEFTTGEGTHSGGYRRPHMHHLVKGIPADHPLLQEEVVEDAEEARLLGKKVGDLTTPLEKRVSDLWRSITGDAFVVECKPLRTPAGAIHYLFQHHRKKVQAPPKGFKGRRLRPSKATKDRAGYYELPLNELQDTADELIRHNRVVAATNRALGVELGVPLAKDRPEFDEWEADEQMTAAISAALGEMALHPAELQLDLDGYYSLPAEESDLVQRVVAKVKELRAASPPELVRVRERPALLDPETGAAFFEAVFILAEDHEDDPFRPKVKT